MDFHKYAYCPKGASVVLYKNREIRKHQIFACADWPGYTVVNAAVQSSKSGGPLAAAWAVLNFVGEDGYLEIARRMHECGQKVIAAIQDMPDVYLMCPPELCLIAFTSDTVNIFHIIDEMKERGWYLQAQLAYPGSKENIHLSVSAANLAQTDQMIADLRESIAKAKELPPPQMATGAGALAAIDPADLTEEMLVEMLATLGVAGSKLPSRMVEINTLLNALPVPLKEKVLVEFFNFLFVPNR
jgi:glutamate/tyrosine decarboxylase-like PLP-dependent enzyme